MRKGALFKRCSCRGENRALLGAGCPKLRRRGGAWSSDHGSWHIQIEVDTAQGQPRIQLRRGGFETREDAKVTLQDIRILLDLSGRAEFPDLARAEIAALIRSALRKGTPLPHADDVRRSIDLGQPVDSTLTVAESLTHWVEVKRTTRAVNTYRAYKAHIDQHLIPLLGHIPVARLTAIHANRTFTQIANNARDAAERNDQRRAARDRARQATYARDTETRDLARIELTTLGPYENSPGAASIHRIRATLRSALTDAAKQGLAPMNVAKFIDLAPERKPRAKLWTAAREAAWRRTGARPGPVMIWTPEHTRTFLTHTKDHEYHALYNLIAHLGLRRGEALALRWENIDFPTGEITIEAQLTQLGWEVIETTPKTEASTRTLIAPQPVLATLATHRRRQHDWAEQAGQLWAPGPGNPSVYVFTNLDGRAIHPDDALEQFQRETRKADLPPIRLLSRPEARFRCCHRPVSPGRSPNPSCRSLGNGLSTVAAVRRCSWWAMGLGSCCPGRCIG